MPCPDWQRDQPASGPEGRIGPTAVPSADCGGRPGAADRPLALSTEGPGPLRDHRPGTANGHGSSDTCLSREGQGWHPGRGSAVGLAAPNPSGAGTPPRLPPQHPAATTQGAGSPRALPAETPRRPHGSVPGEWPPLISDPRAVFSRMLRGWTPCIWAAFSPAPSAPRCEALGRVAAAARGGTFVCSVAQPGQRAAALQVEERGHGEDEAGAAEEGPQEERGCHCGAPCKQGRRCGTRGRDAGHARPCGLGTRPTSPGRWTWSGPPASLP